MVYGSLPQCAVLYSALDLMRMESTQRRQAKHQSHGPLKKLVFRSRHPRTIDLHSKNTDDREWTLEDADLKDEIAFARLTEIKPTEIAGHMSDPRVAEHMPLLTFEWDAEAVAKFVAQKERCWARDGLRHWAILANDRYVGWGGFQKEDNEWDFGLVLRPAAFGLGRRITKKAIDFAIADERFPYVTFLLPPSRKNVSALEKLGAHHVGEIEYEGAKFHKYRLETDRSLHSA